MNDEKKLELVNETIDQLKEKDDIIKKKEKALSIFNKYYTERYKNLDVSINHAENEITELKDHTKKLTDDISIKTKELEKMDVSYDALRALSENRHSLQLNITQLKRDILDAKREDEKVKTLESYIKEKEKKSVF